MRDEIRVISDPEVLHISLEPTRSEILCILSEQDMTVVELSDRLDKHPTTVYRHIKKLEDKDFVRVSGVKWKRHSEEYVYGRTAKLFIPDCSFINGNGKSKLRLVWSKNQVKRLLDCLEKIGYDNNVIGIEDNIYQLFSDLDQIYTDKVKNVLDGGDDLTLLELLAIKRVLLVLSIAHDKEIKEKVESIFGCISEK